MAIDINGISTFAFGSTFIPARGTDAIVLDRHIRGGLHFINGESDDRLADIPGRRLQKGMLVYLNHGYSVVENGRTYSRDSESYYQFMFDSDDDLENAGGPIRTRGALINSESRWEELNFGEQTGLPAFENQDGTPITAMGEYVLAIPTDGAGARWIIESDTIVAPSAFHAFVGTDSDAVVDRIIPGTQASGIASLEFSVGGVSGRDLTITSLAAIVIDSANNLRITDSEVSADAIRQFIGASSNVHYTLAGASDFRAYSDYTEQTLLTDAFTNRASALPGRIAEEDNQFTFTETFLNVTLAEAEAFNDFAGKGANIEFIESESGTVTTIELTIRERTINSGGSIAGDVGNTGANTVVIKGVFTSINGNTPQLAAGAGSTDYIGDALQPGNILEVSTFTETSEDTFIFQQARSQIWEAASREDVLPRLFPFYDDTEGVETTRERDWNSTLHVDDGGEFVWRKDSEYLPTSEAGGHVHTFTGGTDITLTGDSDLNISVTTGAFPTSESGGRVRTFTGGNDITLSGDSDLNISVPAASFAFNADDANDIRINSIQAGDNVTTLDGADITITVDSSNFATSESGGRVRTFTGGNDITLSGDSDLNISVPAASFATTSNANTRINSILGGANVSVSDNVNTEISVAESEFVHSGTITDSTTRIRQIMTAGGINADTTTAGVLTLSADSEAIPLYNRSLAASYATGDLIVVDLPAHTDSTGNAAPFTESIYKVIHGPIPANTADSDLFRLAPVVGDTTGLMSPYIEEAFASGDITEVLHDTEERLLSYIDQQISAVKEQQQQLVEILDVTDINVFEGKHDANWKIDLSRDTVRLPHLAGTTTGRVVQGKGGFDNVPFNPSRDEQSPKAGLFTIRSGNTGVDLQIHNHIHNAWADVYQYYVRQYVAVRPITRAAGVNLPNTGANLRTWVNQDPLLNMPRGGYPDPTIWDDSNFIIYIAGYNDYRYAFTPPADFSWDGIYEFVEIDPNDLPTADVRVDAHRSGDARVAMQSLPGTDANNPIDRSPETPLPVNGLRIATTNDRVHRGNDRYVSITLATIAEAKAFATLVDQSMGGNGTDLPGYLLAHNTDNFNWYPLCTSYRTRNGDFIDTDATAQDAHQGINVRYPSLDTSVDSKALFATNLHRVDIYPNNPNSDSDATQESFDRVLIHSHEFGIGSDARDIIGYPEDTFPIFPPSTVTVSNIPSQGFIGESPDVFAAHNTINRVIFVPRIEALDARRFDFIDSDTTKDGLTDGPARYLELEYIRIDSDDNRTYHAAQLDNLVAFELSNLSALSLTDVRANPYHRPKEFRYSDTVARTIDVPAVEYTRRTNDSATWITFNMGTPESFTDYLSQYEPIGNGSTSRNYFGGGRRGIAVFDSDLDVTNQGNSNTRDVQRFGNNQGKYTLINPNEAFAHRLTPSSGDNEFDDVVLNKYISNVPRWSQGIMAATPEKFDENFFNPNSSSTNRHTVYLDQSRIFLPRDRFTDETDGSGNPVEDSDTTLPIDFTKGHIPVGPSWIISDPEARHLRYRDEPAGQGLYNVPFARLNPGNNDALPVTLRTNVSDFRPDTIPDADTFDIETRTNTGHLEVNELYALRRNANMFNPTIHGITILQEEIDSDTGFVVRDVVSAITFTVDESDAILILHAADLPANIPAARIRVGSNQTNPFSIVDVAEIDFQVPGRHAAITTFGPNGATPGAPIFLVDLDASATYEKPVTEFSPRGDDPMELVNKGYVDSEIGQINTRIGATTTNTINFNTRLHNIESEIGHVEIDGTARTSRIDTLASKVARIESEIGHLDINDSEDSDILSRMARIESELAHVDLGTISLSDLADVDSDSLKLLRLPGEDGALLSYSEAESDWRLAAAYITRDDDATDRKSDHTGQAIGTSTIITPTNLLATGGDELLLKTDTGVFIERNGTAAHRFVLPLGTQATFGDTQTFQDDSDLDFGFNIFGFLRSDTSQNIFHIPGPDINSHHFIGSILQLAVGTVYTRAEFIAAMVLAMDRVIRGKQPTHVDGGEVDLETTDVSELAFMSRFSEVYADPVDPSNAIILVNRDNSPFATFQTTAVIYDPTGTGSTINVPFVDYTTSGIQKVITDFTLHDQILESLDDPFIEAFIGEGSIEHLSDVTVLDSERVNNYVLAWDSDHVNTDGTTGSWMSRDPGAITEVHVKITELDDVYAPDSDVKDGFVLAWDSDHGNVDEDGVLDGTLGAWIPVSVRTAVTSTSLGHLQGVDSDIDSAASTIANADPESIAIVVRSQTTGADGAGEWRTVDLLEAAPDNSKLIFTTPAGAGNENFRDLTSYRENGIPEVIRNLIIGNGQFRVELPNFSPGFSATVYNFGLALGDTTTPGWDTPLLNFVISGTNPTDFSSQFILAVNDIVGVPAVNANDRIWDDYSRNNPELNQFVIPAETLGTANNAWTQTFQPNNLNGRVRPQMDTTLNGNGEAVGGSVSTTYDYIVATGEPNGESTYTGTGATGNLSITWPNASTTINFGSVDSRLFLDPVELLTFTGGSPNVLNETTPVENAITRADSTDTETNFIYSNANNDGLGATAGIDVSGTLTFGTPFYSESSALSQNISGHNLTRRTTLRRPSIITGSQYVLDVMDTTSTPRVTFEFPSFYLFIENSAGGDALPTLAEVEAVLRRNPNADTASVGVYTTATDLNRTTVTNPSATQTSRFWFGVQVDKSLPTVFTTDTLRGPVDPIERDLVFTTPGGNTTYRLFGINFGPDATLQVNYN